MLSDQEQGRLTGQLSQEDIAGIERQIKRKLQHRGTNWSTRVGSTGEKPVTIALVGLGGVGKSTLGNLLVGEDVFPTSLGASTGTKECHLSGTEFQKEEYIVIDTPACVGWDQLGKAIEQIPAEQRDGIHVFILVMNASGFRSREREMESVKVFNDVISDRWMVVATHSTLAYAHDSAHKFVEDVSAIPDIKSFMEKIKKHVVLVDCGSAQMNPDTALDGNAVSDREKEQGRTMVFDMIREVSKSRGVDPRVEETREVEKKKTKKGFLSHFSS